MTSLGIDLKKEEVRWCSVSGTLAAPAYLAHGRKKYQVTADRPAMMRTFQNIINEIIAETTPSIIGYRVTPAANSVDQLAYLIMPLGVLALMCGEKSIPTREFSSMAFTAKRFCLARGVDPVDHWTSLVGPKSPNWDQNAAMSAWAALNA